MTIEKYGSSSRPQSEIGDYEELSREFKLFREIEKEVLIEEGLETLYRYLIHCEVSRLPKLLIFPETSGRVACWLVKPIFDYVYRKRNLQPPFYCFVKIPPAKHIPSYQMTGGSLARERIREIVDKTNLNFSNNVVWIVDTFYYSGRTYSFLKDILSDFFPIGNIAGFVFVAESNSLPKEILLGLRGREFPGLVFTPLLDVSKGWHSFPSGFFDSKYVRRVGSDELKKYGEKFYRRKDFARVVREQIKEVTTEFLRRKRNRKSTFL